ncbi:hypothetical protein [Micromonospora sagamiensis]|uniref:Uncharacterized protein n=1 Tax=Micromonospora sagamiensis TaxID=47875 RepID=A0A562WP21_9ACTN|nr:hypothetical protein [Micromonospora sagamiensis]TWJ31998.1 hypothetical protein JD81_05564 [Micromonospora sagamiensis]
MSTRAIFGLAARGAGVGAAVVAAAYLAYRFAEAYAQADSNNYTNSADALGVASIVFLGCGLPLCYLTGVTIALLSRLPRPWLVSAGGLAAGTVLGCGVRPAGIGWTVLTVLSAYASAAVAAALMVRSARRTAGT